MKQILYATGITSIALFGGINGANALSVLPDDTIKTYQGGTYYAIADSGLYDTGLKVTNFGDPLAVGFYDDLCPNLCDHVDDLTYFVFGDFYDSSGALLKSTQTNVQGGPVSLTGITYDIANVDTSLPTGITADQVGSAVWEIEAYYNYGFSYDTSYTDQTTGQYIMQSDYQITSRLQSVTVNYMAPVPLPASGLLFAGLLFGIGFFTRKSRA